MSLKLDGVDAAYGSSQILFGLSMETARGRVTTLLGRNGMGKTTTVNAIMGHIPAGRGGIFHNGRRINGLPVYRMARMGIALVPEGRRIFPNLSVKENLIATAANYGGAADPWTLDRVLALFPVLEKRLGGMGNQLSGGEQQMLAVGRALMLNPELLILDEATEGLAPLVREQIWEQLQKIRQTGITILLIDKNLEDLCRIADYHYVIEKGSVVWDGDSDSLRASPDVREGYLGI